MIEKNITYQYQGDSGRFISKAMNLEASNPAQKPFWYSVHPIIHLVNFCIQKAKILSMFMYA